MLRRTIHAARYLSDPPYRRAISRQLNKGDSLHSLRRDLHYANQGAIAKVRLTQQTEHAWCLTVLTNAVVTWTTDGLSIIEIVAVRLTVEELGALDEAAAKAQISRSEAIRAALAAWAA